MVSGMKLKMRSVVLGLLAGMCLGSAPVFAQLTQNDLVNVNKELQDCIEGLDPNGMDPSNPAKYTTADPARFENPTFDVPNCTNGGSLKLKLFQGNSELTGCYDDTGKRIAGANPPCITDSVCVSVPNCVFQVSATVVPTCRKSPDNINSLASCGKAESFKFDYDISQVKALPGMPTFATVKSADGTDRPGITMPYSAIRAAQYTKVDCPTLFPGNKAKAFSVGVDSLGQPICGPDPNQDMIDALQDEVCRSQIERAWIYGGQSTGLTSSGSGATIKCEKIHVTKEFKCLDSFDKTTTTCGQLVANGIVVTNSNETDQNKKITDFSGYVGGVVRHDDATGAKYTWQEVQDLRTKYGLAAPATQFYCRSVVTTDNKVSMIVGKADSPKPFTLPQTYVANSFRATLVGGGGGGGGGGTSSSCGPGGNGGQAGAYLNAEPYPAAAAGDACTVTVGGGGAGGSPEACWTGPPLMPIPQWLSAAGKGEATKVVCASAVSPLEAAGGTQALVCSGGENGSAGANSLYSGSGGGTAGKCSDGGDASAIGAGGGGGGNACPCVVTACCCFCKGTAKGGSGFNGYAYITYDTRTVTLATVP